MTAGPRFSVIPAGAILDPALKGQDLRVLCLLGRHTNDNGWCRRSQVKMARQLDCSRSTVQTALRRLEDAGWIEHRPVVRDNGGDAAHDYRVVLDRDGDYAERVERAARLETEAETAEADLLDVVEGGAGISAGGAGIPAGGADPGPAGGAGPGPAPMLTTPVERSPVEREERETRARGPGNGDGTTSRSSVSLAADGDAVASAGAGCPPDGQSPLPAAPGNNPAILAKREADTRFAQFQRLNERSAVDDKARVRAAFDACSLDEQREGVDRYRVWLHHITTKLNAKHPPGGERYWRGKLWREIPADAAGDADKPVCVKADPWTKPWWAMLAAAAHSGDAQRLLLLLDWLGEGRGRMLSPQAPRDALALSVLGRFVQARRDSAEFAAMRTRIERAAGRKMPDPPSGLGWVSVPDAALAAEWGIVGAGDPSGDEAGTASPSGTGDGAVPDQSASGGQDGNVSADGGLAKVQRGFAPEATAQQGTDDEEVAL